MPAGRDWRGLAEFRHPQDSHTSTKGDGSKQLDIFRTRRSYSLWEAPHAGFHKSLISLVTDDKTNQQSLRWQKVTEAGTRCPVQQQQTGIIAYSQQALLHRTKLQRL